MKPDTTQPREQAIPETTDQAREYLVEWHKSNLPYAPYFSNYIRTDLAGDFAFHLARWFARASLAPVAAPEAPILPPVVCVGRPFPTTNKATIHFARDVSDAELLEVNRALKSRLNNLGASTGAAPEAPASEKQNAINAVLKEMEQMPPDELRALLDKHRGGLRLELPDPAATTASADKLREYTTLLNVAEAELSAMDRDLTAAKATTASASGDTDSCPKCASSGWLANATCEHRRATAPSRNAAPLDAKPWREVHAAGSVLPIQELMQQEIDRLRAALTQQSATQAPSADAERDADRFRRAIALEDNAETLYAAVLNHTPDAAAIRREFDAAMSAATEQGEKP